MRRALFALSLTLLPLPAAAASPVVVELFTSQGCSSCPPADRVLTKLAAEPGVIAISRPVTYWDRLGWKDTLARTENTALQSRYSKHFGRRDVFTPQAVVDGARQTVGSRETEVRALVAREAARPAPVAVRLARAADGGVSVAVRGEPGAPAQVRAVLLRSAAEVAIGRGENGGRKVRYTNVVLDERVLGEHRGGEARFTLPAAAVEAAKGADRIAVIVQPERLGAVAGAALAPL